jgi:hypothetical protein
MGVGKIQLLQTNDSVTNEWEALESNKTLVGTELIGNIPSTTLVAS